MNAYITLADSEEYLKCAYALALSLNRAKSAYPLYIMIPQNSISYNTFPIVENTKIVEIPLLMFNSINSTADFNTTINKFFCVSYEEYDKVIFLDADIFIYFNIDFLFEQKFPIITLDKDEIRGGIFGLKTDKILLSFIINLAIRYNFSNDEEVLACLFNNNYLPIGSLANNCHKYLYHDAGYPKMWSLYNYNEIKEIIDNNKIDFNIPKIVFHNNDLQEQYMLNTLKRIKEKYETI